jgi:hypothetical protein
MIEINLIPDVKQELLKAQKVRSMVISIALFVGIAAIALVIILGVWVFGVQIARGVITDNSIKSESHKLASVPDISNTLTIQNQLSLLSKLHSSNTVTLSAQAANGYPALEVFKKTIEATTFQYTQNGQNQSVPLATNMSDSDRSYGEDVTGAKVLRFNLVFTYADQLFAPDLSNARIVAPTKANATDSYLGVPTSLFIQKANDTAGGAK